MISQISHLLKRVCFRIKQFLLTWRRSGRKKVRSRRTVGRSRRGPIGAKVPRVRRTGRARRARRTSPVVKVEPLVHCQPELPQLGPVVVMVVQEELSPTAHLLHPPLLAPLVLEPHLCGEAKKEGKWFLKWGLKGFFSLFTPRGSFLGLLAHCCNKQKPETFLPFETTPSFPKKVVSTPLRPSSRKGRIYF